MWVLVLCFIYAVSVNSWRLTPTCTLPSENRWKIRQELDMLSRFTGHDTLDKYTKNWVRQHSIQRTILLGDAEKVTSLRVVDRNRLAIVSDKRRWEVDLQTGETLFQHKLLASGKYTLSLDGRRLYHTSYEPRLGCHVVTCNGTPMIVTDEFPYHVTESLDGATTCVGLCSEHVMVASLDGKGHLKALQRDHVEDVALASVGLKDKVFHGLLDGRVCVRDIETGARYMHTLRRQKDSVVPSVRSIDVEMLGPTYCVYVGCQDGVVRACRFDEGAKTSEILEFSSRRLHRCPVTKVRCHSSRVVSGDEEGHVVVTDMHGTKVMYTILMDQSGDVSFDLNQRFLVVGRGNVVRVWDHDHPMLGMLGMHRAMHHRKRGKGGGGRSVSR